MSSLDQIQVVGDGGGGGAISCIGDPYYTCGPTLEDWDKVVLLLSFDEADGTLVLVDSSSYADNRTLNAGRGAVISTGSSKFGAASLKCTQVGPEGTVWTGERFQWLSGRPITMEGWFRKVSAQNYTSSPLIFRLNSQYGLPIFTLEQYSTGNTLSVRYGVDASENYGYTPGPDGYVHWALTHDGNQTANFFINGVVARTWSGSGFGLGSVIAAWTLYIAGVGSQTLGPIEFYIDEFRFWNGKLVYTADFTPPIAAFPRDTSGWLRADPRTVLSIHADDTPPVDQSCYQTKTVALTGAAFIV